MNCFQVNSHLKSYTYPLVKIIIFISIIIIAIYRDKFFTLNNSLMEFIAGIICLCIVVGCILCIYISFAELILTHENREKVKADIATIAKSGTEISIREIMSLVLSNDIIELHVLVNEKIVEIGSSSDCDPGSSKFFDKKFFIDEKEFETGDEFENELKTLANQKKFNIISIDGNPST